MHKLLDFLVRKRHWALFLLLEVFSFALIYRNSAYQHSVMFSTANTAAASVVSVGGSVISYMSLREVNDALMEKNAYLEMEVLRLRSKLEELNADDSLYKAYHPDSIANFPYAVTKAQVLDNSVSYISNYITINKGKADGIMPDMGVISAGGVTGIVSTVSEHYAVIIPILNPKFRLSCKVSGSNYFGSMSWNGRDTKYAQLDELPRHVEFNVGDTIVTSGFSAIFPEGLLVGTIHDFERQRDDNFYSLTIELSTDFHNLGNVMVIKNYHQQERRQIEKEATGNV
jgi:rod shape-determining protein MreC